MPEDYTLSEEVVNEKGKIYNELGFVMPEDDELEQMLIERVPQDAERTRRHFEYLRRLKNTQPWG